MTSESILLSPPSPFRQRVVAPIFYEEHATELHQFTDECVNAARTSFGIFTDAASWIEQLVRVQKLGKLPHGAEDLINYAELGAACARLEQTRHDFMEGETSYIAHACLAMFAFDENKPRQMLQSLAIDGAYYLVHTKLSADAIGESLLNALT